MNVEKNNLYRTTLSAILFSAQCIFVLPAQAVDVRDIFNDPLRTKHYSPVKKTITLDYPQEICSRKIDYNRLIKLRDAIGIALCNHPQLNAALAQIDIQAAAVGETRAAYLPTIDAAVSRIDSSTGYQSTQENYKSSSTGNQASGSIRWLLFDFGTRDANRRAANKLMSSERLSYEASLRQVILSVIDSYFYAVTEKLAYDSSLKIVQLSTDIYSITKRRQTRGAALITDSLHASAALAKARLHMSKTKRSYEKALSMLIHTMGLEANKNYSLKLLEQPEKFQDINLGDIEIYLTEVENNHPEINAAKAKWEANLDKIAASRSEALPTLTGFFTISKNEYPNQGLSKNNQTEIVGGITVNLPIFEGFARTYKTRGIEAQAELSRMQLEDIKNKILTDVKNSYFDVTASLEALQVADILLGATEEAAQSARRRHLGNVADSLELLNTELALVDAKQEKNRANFEYASARIRLLARVGILNYKL